MNKRTETKNIFIISAVFPPEPVVSANISFDLAKCLSESNLVTVLSPKPSRPAGYVFSESENSQNVFKHVVLKSYICPRSKILGRFYESYSFGRACYNYIQGYNDAIDVIYMNTWPLLAQWMTVRACKKFKIPIVTHIQDVYPESLINKLPILKSLLYKLLIPLDKYISVNSTKLITISKGVSNLIVQSRGIDKDKLEVVYNWQDEKKYLVRSAAHYDNAPFVFMFLGSLSPSAAIDGIILAFIRLNCEKCKLIIAGRGSEEERLKNLARGTGGHLVEFIDAPSENVGKIQAESDVLILSLKKGVAKLALPSKLPAYMFSSKPIIASVDVESDTACVIIESGCGWVVDPESVDKLSEQMRISMGTDRKKLMEIGEKGYQYAIDHFSKQYNLNRLAEIIQSVATK